MKSGKIELGVFFVVSLIMLGTLGCMPPPEGTEASARQHFKELFSQWANGNESRLRTPELIMIRKPVAYEILLVNPCKPSFMAQDTSSGHQANYTDFPSFNINAKITVNTEQGASDRIGKYNFTWNTNEKKWYVSFVQMP